MKHRNPAPRGMALIAVLWLVAAMSLILAGVVRSVRTEAQTAGVQRQAAMASATADAAILLALQQLHAGQKETPKGLQTIPIEFAGTTHAVHVAPLNGLIDLNNAPIALLDNLYHYAAGLDAAAAHTLAQATLDTRERANAKHIVQGFSATEDLMGVPGMTYTLYAKVASLVTAAIKSGSGRVNPLAASYEVLLVLTAGNAAQAMQIASQRATDAATLDTTFLTPDLIDMSTSSSLTFQVSIGLPDGSVLQKKWLIFWAADPRTDLPWRVLDTRQSISVPSAETH